MDSNGQRFWLAIGGTPWKPDIPGTLELLPAHLQLASQTNTIAYPETPDDANDRLKLVPGARDTFGTRAFLDADGLTVRATGAFSEPEATASSPVLYTATAPVTDLALGFDNFLYVVTDGKIQLQPLSNRYPPLTLTAAGISAWRIAPRTRRRPLGPRSDQ